MSADEATSLQYFVIAALAKTEAPQKASSL